MRKRCSCCAARANGSSAWSSPRCADHGHGLPPGGTPPRTRCASTLTRISTPWRCGHGKFRTSAISGLRNLRGIRTARHPMATPDLTTPPASVGRTRHATTGMTNRWERGERARSHPGIRLFTRPLPPQRRALPTTGIDANHRRAPFVRSSHRSRRTSSWSVPPSAMAGLGNSRRHRPPGTAPTRRRSISLTGNLGQSNYCYRSPQRKSLPLRARHLVVLLRSPK